MAYEKDIFWYDVGSTEKYEKLDKRFVDARAPALSS
jgi:hypothetical protein